MNAPISLDVSMGSIHEQPQDTVRCEWEFALLLEYDRQCKLQYASKIIREGHGARGYKSAVKYANRILKEAKAELARSENQ